MSLSCARLQGHKESPYSTAPASGGALAHVRTALLSHGTGKENKHIRKGHTQLLGTALGLCGPGCVGTTHDCSLSSESVPYTT